MHAAAAGVQKPGDFDTVFATATRERPDALFAVADPLTVLNRRRILAFAVERRLPTMYEFRGYVDEGGLMAWGRVSTSRPI
jgi:putative tryptophan/tyrosine transport system substrate-binding protein